MKVVYTTKVKEDGDTLVVKRPSRKEIADTEMLRSVKWGQLTKQGCLTNKMLDKIYEESGGIYTKEEQDEQKALQEKLTKAVGELTALNKKEKLTKKEETRKDQIEKEVREVWSQFGDFEQKRQAAYSQTAESLARSYVVTNLFYLLTHKQTGDDSYEKFFKYEKFENNDEHYEEIFDGENTDLQDALIRCFTVAAILYNRPNSTSEEIDTYFKDMQDGAR